MRANLCAAAALLLLSPVVLADLDISVLLDQERGRSTVTRPSDSSERTKAEQAAARVTQERDVASLQPEGTASFAQAGAAGCFSF